MLAAKFDLPSNKVIDRQLIAGGVIFGAGWGIAGMCPGPALVNLASPYGAPLIWVASMFAGLKMADMPFLKKAVGSNKC